MPILSIDVPELSDPADRTCSDRRTRAGLATVSRQWLLLRAFIHAFIYSFVHSIIRSFIHSDTLTSSEHQLIQSFMLRKVPTAGLGNDRLVHVYAGA